MYPYSHYKASAALLAALALASSGSAQTLTKAANNDSLLTATSWTPNTVPGAGNLLEFTSAWTGAQVSMGGSLNVAGINYTNVAGNSGRISGGGGQTLSLGSGGVDLTGTGGTLRIDPAIVLTATQEWAIGTGRILNLVASGMSGGFTAQVTGAGTLAFDASGTATYGSQLEIDVTTLRINFASSDVTFTNANNSFTTLNIFNGTARFSSIANSGSDSAAGAFTTGSLGGNATNGVFVYTGNTASTNRAFTVDRRSTASGILVSTAGQTLTISGNISHIGSNAAIANNSFRVGGDGNLILSGIVSNNTTPGFNTALAKEGTGTLTLGGNNTFLGGVTISAGTVTISANERIANANKLTLSGGNFDVATFTETLGALDLNGTGGTLTLGTGGAFIFADSSAESWAGSLTVVGAFISGNSLRFGLNASGLSGTQLLALSIPGFTDIALNGAGFVTATAIPEPSAFAALAGLGALSLVGLRRRRRA